MRAENRGCLFSDERDVPGSEVRATYIGRYKSYENKLYLVLCDKFILFR